MIPEDVIRRFYPETDPLYRVLMDHGRAVAEKSLEITAGLPPDLVPDTEFIEQAAMLHDIGMFLTRADSIGCTGDYPYICHGYLGRQILDDLGLDPRLGMVCERHTGAGITLANIRAHDLPLPHRDMVPGTLEEKIICVADKFHSKSPHNQDRIYTVPLIMQTLAGLDAGHAERFSQWTLAFGMA